MRAFDRTGSRAAAPDPEQDRSLVAGAVAGDRRMFAELYRRHLDAVYLRLTRMIGPVPERDDLVQHIFLDVHRALPRFRGEAAFSTFLHRIVVNVACEHLERRRRGGGLVLEEQHLDELIDPTDSPELRARQRQELSMAWRQLEELSPKRRIAFVLVVVEEMSLREAAALAGASPDAVKQRVLEARRDLNRGRIERDREPEPEPESESAEREGRPLPERRDRALPGDRK